MEPTPKQQISELIKKGQKILILTHKNPDGDAVGSLLALGEILKKIGKTVELVCPTSIPEIYKFLAGVNEINLQFSGTKELIIGLNTATVKIDKLGYRHDEDKNRTNIIITPSAGSFRKEDVEIIPGSFEYDLIIVLDCPNLERLGDLYENNSSLFYETPIVNIDHHSANDYFGKVNWVDLTATSTAEILVALLESLAGQLDLNLLNENVATALLTGIIGDTNSFQNRNTTPKSLTVAAQLIAAGAAQQEIIKRLYKTKTFSTLKLWGQALSNLTLEKSESQSSFVWSSLSHQDFELTQAKLGEELGLIDELLKSAPDAKFALLLSQYDQVIRAELRSIDRSTDVAAIAATFGGGGHVPAAGFSVPIDQNFEKTRAVVIEKLKQ